MNEILKKIKELREKKFLSQDDIAVKMGIKQQVYSNIEKGKCRLLVEHLLKISEVLEVPVSCFFQEKSLDGNEDWQKTIDKLTGMYKKMISDVRDDKDAIIFLLKRDNERIETELERTKKVVVQSAASVAV